MSMGICGLIFALLFVFKIAGIAGMATVSWWIVFLPLYGPFILWAVAAAIIGGFWYFITKR